MCIRHIQFFECPSKDGPPKRHRVKSNILCSHNFPCQQSHWERRTSYYRCMCPGCSGESPSIPRENPYRDEWQRETSQDEAWVQGFLHCLSNSASLWIWGKLEAAVGHVTIEQIVGLYPSFFFERRCKQNAHRPAECRCEANGPLAFLYNPATAVRRSLTNDVAMGFEQDRAVQSGAARAAFAEVHKALTAVCRSGNDYFKDGVSRQPFFSARAIDWRRQLLIRTINNSWESVRSGLLRNAEACGDWTEGHVLMETHGMRRANLVRFMGEILLYDSGISNARFSLAIERLAHIVQLPQWRAPSRIQSLEQVANAASLIDREPRPEEPFNSLIGHVLMFFADKREKWTTEVRRYKARRMLFDQCTSPVDGAKLRALPDSPEDCGICYTTYWESPSAPSATASPVIAQRTWPGRRPSQANSAESEISNQIRRLKWDGDLQARLRGFRITPAGVDMFDYGEPAVRIIECDHVFGRSCLFHMWVSDADTPEQRPRCPYCRGEPPEVVYRLVEVTTGFSLRPEPPGAA